MQVQTIEKIAVATFVTSWNCQESMLKLDFNLLIQHFKLTGQFCLMHWQAKPKGLRRWGVYCSIQDSYFSTDWDRIVFEPSLQIETLQVDERVVKTVPTAVMCFRGAIAEFSEEKILVRRS